MYRIKGGNLKAYMMCVLMDSARQILTMKNV